jgi:hypothetical protein
MPGTLENGLAMRKPPAASAKSKEGDDAVASFSTGPRNLSAYGRRFWRFSKSLTFETTIVGNIAGSRYVRRPGFDGALSQVREAVDLRHFGSAPQISDNAADHVRLLPMQSNLELRAGAGHGRGLRRQHGACCCRLKDRTDQAADGRASLPRSSASSSASQALALSTLPALMWPKPRIFAGSDAISTASAWLPGLSEVASSPMSAS